MTTALFKDGFPSAHRNTRQRIESRIDLRRLFSAIDADPALIGAGVVYIDEDFNVLTLREFQAVCGYSQSQWCCVRRRGQWGRWSSSGCWSMSRGSRTWWPRRLSPR